MHHDALVMQAHFAEVMKEVPPTFMPPRKYNTAKRRAEQEAQARHETVPGSGASDGGGDRKRRRTSRGYSESVPPEDDRGDSDGGDYYGEGSVPPPRRNPFGLPSPAALKVEDGVSATEGMGPLTSGGSPSLPPLPLPPLQPGLQTSASYGFPGPVNGGGSARASRGPATPLPVPGSVGASGPAIDSQRPRMLAKVTSGAAQSCE